MEKELEEKVNSILREVSELKKLFLEKIEHPVSTDNKKTHEEMVDSEVICTVFKISKKTLWNYRKKNLVPFHKIAGKVYFYVSEVEKALKEHYYGVKTSEPDTP